MHDVATTLLIVIAACAWIAAFVFAVAMLPYRKRPLRWLAMNGLAFFGQQHFAVEARPHRRRFLLSVAVFAAAVLALIVLGVLRSV
jgi:hypothetical protein